jgi:glucokinase
MAESLAVGIDLGGTKLAGALVDAHGKIVAKREEPTRSERGPDAVVASMATLVRGLEAEGAKLGREVVGVGVGAPAPLDPRTGVVWAMPNLGPAWKGYPLKAKLEAALGDKRVAVENDANAAMVGEAWIGAAARARDAALLTLGTGVGGGIVTAGVIVRGSRGVGAELGHIMVEREGHPCGCGGHGCLEQYASGTAVARLAREALARNQRGALAALGHAPSTQEVVTAARSGDELAREVIAFAGKMLGCGLVTIVHALNPEVVVLGGGFGTAAFDLLAPPALAEFTPRVLEASREGLRIVPAALGNDAGIVGAARSAFTG